MKTEKYLTPEGFEIKSVKIEDGELIAEYKCKNKSPEPPKFKRGDFMVLEYSKSKIISLIDYIESNGLIHYLALYKTKEDEVLVRSDIGLGRVSDGSNSAHIRLAIPEEKQLLLDKMHKVGKDWDGEKVIDWVWKPKMGDGPYWYINTGGYYRDSCWSDGEIDNERLKENRAFATEALAKSAYQELQTVLKQAKKY